MRYNAVIDVQRSLPGSEPVTLAEAKEYCRVDGSSSDAVLTEMITAARLQCENYTNISFINQTVTATLINQQGDINLPYGPVGTINTFTDRDGIDIEDYNITGGSFKQLRERYEHHVTVTYLAGYEILPADLKNAVLAQVDWLFNFRGSDSEIAPAVETRLSKYRQVI